MSDWIRLLRPLQWTKNGFVLSPLLFSGQLLDRTAVVHAAAAFMAFCLAASGAYALNDVGDRVEDRRHPVKRLRPVAAGRIGVGPASAAGIALLLAAITLAWEVRPELAVVIATYVLLNALYSWWLKHVVLLDVFCIAAFFILRLLAGAEAIAVRPSVWLLLCGGLLALYLGFAKRRQELILLGEHSAGHRSVLSQYTPALLDQMSAVLLSVTIVSYLMYTLTSETARMVGSDALGYSTLFVLYGAFRYLFLVHRRDLGSPTETIMADGPLLVTVGLWLGYCGWVVYRQ